jgi:ABC-type sugar transport system substrate-binding protein
VNRSRLAVLLVAVGLALALAACGSVDNDDSSGTEAKKSNQTEVSANVAAVRAFDEEGAKPKKQYKIAYLTECAQNVYCKARLRGLQAAADKFGFTFKTFDPNFNPSAQLKLVQDAVAEGGWDGYLFAPTAGEPGCAMWERFLKPDGKPVVTLDLPMCGDPDYTPGLAGTVTMQRQQYFNELMDNAFAQCKGKCKAVTFSGFTGSDLFNFWTKASDYAEAKHPNVEVIEDYPAEFDPQKGRQDMQDALQANPDIDLVVSHDDAMASGVTSAIKSAGLTPGKDVKVYSTGGSQIGVDALASGEFNETTVLDPYDEAYYAAVALIMALEGKAVNGYINEAELPRITDGPGTIFITPENVAEYETNWG